MNLGWSDKKGNISQKILDGIRPQPPLRSRIETAQKMLETRITKLDAIHANLQKKDEDLFKKIVSAHKSHDEYSARAYALELNEQRKISRTVNNARLAMDQVRTRLSTVSEYGDIVVTLSPCMSLIKGMSESVSGIMPGANESMEDFAKTIGDILGDSSMGSGMLQTDMTTVSAESQKILDDAHSIVETNTKQRLPDLPDGLAYHKSQIPKEVNLKQDIMSDKQVYT